jgi:cell wall-associated NlpC family hydrolase
VLATGTPASSDQLSDAQARAAQLQQEINATGQRISALGQEYDAAVAKESQLNQQITATEAKIAQARHQVASDQSSLRNAAVNAYIDAGSAATANPLFSTNQSSVGTQQEYTSVANGDLNDEVANLHIAQAQLAQQQADLQSQEQAAQAAASEASTAQSQAQQEQQAQAADLSQVKGQIQTLVAQQQAAQAAAAAAAAQAKLAAAKAAAAAAAQSAGNGGNASTGGGGGGGSTSGGGGGYTGPPLPPLPAAPGAATAVAAAESQIGVPYVWAGESPRGTPGDPSGGFDCSGLTAWAWGQAGVSLPHYSGAQMADSTPVSLSDLQPGDLLFYGPGGDEHVAMYIGGGEMIEAPYTGATVWITGLRLGDGFAGAGRP